MPTFDLIALYQMAFGKFTIAMEGEGNIDVYSSNDAYKKSIMGTKIFFPLSLDGYDMPNEPMISVTGNKVVVKTVLAGVQGTVKEEISVDDYQVTIEGIAINDDSDDYPEEIVQKIINICEKPGRIKVVSDLMKLFNVQWLVIESYNFQGIEGHQNCQSYTLNCVSDRPVPLVFKS